MMQTSEYGKKLIKSFEGLRLNRYKDSGGTFTIGYGHTSSIANGLPEKITEKEADMLFEADIKKAENAVNLYVGAPYTFNQNQYDALVSFAFNIGNIKQLTKNGTRCKAEIGQAMLLYTKCAGKELKGLKVRREKEHVLYCTFPQDHVCLSKGAVIESVDAIVKPNTEITAITHPKSEIDVYYRCNDFTTLHCKEILFDTDDTFLLTTKGYIKLSDVERWRSNGN